MKIISAIIILIMITVPAYATIGDIIRAFPTPGPCPTGLTSDGKNLILADRKTDKIYTLSPESGEIIGSFEAPGYRPYGLAYDSTYLWMVDGEENVIIQINLLTKINIKTISSPAAGPSGLAWDGKYLWLIDTQAGKLLQVSTEDGTTVKELVAPSNSPNAIAFDGTYLWVADRMEDKIYIVWPSTGEVILMFKSPGQYTNGLAILNNQLYCADYQTDSIYVIAIDDNKNCLIQDPVRLTLEYTDQFRNYGPGTVLDLAIYLALPQDSPHQTIIESPVFPDSSKYDITTDKWGQKIARFNFDTVKSGQVVQASYKVVADIFDLWYLIRPEKVGPFKEVPKNIKDKYLVDDTKFAITSPTIRDAVKAAVGDETNPYWVMRKIFRYVIDHLEYQLSGGWNIAPAVLERGNGSCSEYSFVFIAMCRAAGLPARYSGAITQRGDLASEDDVFHRWCEVYLPGYGWIPVDPSGGDQKSPGAQASYIGHVANRYLVTTLGGGGSEYLTWTYNSDETYKSSGICKIYSEHIGQWSPVASPTTSSSPKTSEPEKCKTK